MTSADYYRYLKKDEGGHIGHVSPLVVRLVAAYSPNTATRQWLDIGAGSGFLVEQARLAGWDAQGIEVGHWGTMAAQERSIPIIQALFEEYEFGAQKFDVLSAIDVLEHTGDVISFVRKCRDLARLGSLFVVAVPCSSSPHGSFKFLRRRWAMIGPPSHLHYFSHRSLLHLLRSGGFEPLEFMRYEVGGYPIGKLQLVRKLVDKLARFVVNRLDLGDQILVVARSVARQVNGTSPFNEGNG
jgi:SAM-dependent methyltransferase